MSNHQKKSVLRFELAPRDRPGRIALHTVRWGLLVVLALLTYLLFPVATGFDVLDVGDVAPAEIIAPFEFLVPKSSDELDRERAAMAAAVMPIYEFRQDLVDSALGRARVVFAALDSAGSAAELAEAASAVGLGQLSREETEYLIAPGRLATFENAVRTMIRRHLVRGVPAAGFTQLEPSSQIVIRRGDMESVERRDSVFTFERFLEARAAVQTDRSNVGDQLLLTFLRVVFRPTLEARVAETDSLRQEVRNAVETIRDTVRENERIIDANVVVTPDVRDRLLAFRQELLRQGRAERSIPGTAGQILTNVLVLALLWVLLMLFLPDTYASLKLMLVLALLFGLVVLGAAFLAREAPELIPIPFAAMLVTVLFGGRLGMVSAMVLAVLIAPQAVFGGADSLFIALVGGAAAALSVRSIRRRNQLLISVTVVTGAFLLAGLTVGLRGSEPAVAEIGETALLGGANALVSAGLVYVTLPLFESMTGVTTALTLLELSDPNRPLLRRLATEAPGTYAHSVALANLCEATCTALGANGLLARVGCYYHDVGKLKKPQFFVENQVPGVNPHDKLKPEVSAAMIRNHVKEGLALANEHRLPAAVKAFISEHHGTMEITYFLDRARSRDGEEEIKSGDYRYPGPKPQSVETAVAMLGDGVEAALRVLDDPSPQKVREAIDHLVRQRIEAGQLDEAPLTMAQLSRVRQEFARVYEGIHHNRIDYPTASGGISAGWDAASDA